MAYILILLGLAAIASCPILFAGWWAQRWFRVCCYIAIWLLLGSAYMTYRGIQ